MSRNMTQKMRSAAFGFCAALLTSGGAVADILHLDDVIIDGSLCVGFDCVNGESFSFATIRLKENNTRIDFTDTSAAAGFPTRDWRIEANSSASGGASYLALKDMGNSATGAEGGTAILTVTATAPANSIFVDSSGRVGFRTSTPVLPLHARNGNTPALRLEQDGSSGFAPQTWDIAGNETSFFVRDATGGSTLPFRIFPGSASNRLIVRNSNVGVGTIDPQTNLHVSAGTGTVNLRLQGGGGNFDLSADNGQNRLRIFDNGGNARFTIDPAGNIGIGTIGPSAQLHTTGTVRFEGISGCGAGIQSDGSGNLACLASTRRLKNVAGILEPQVALANVMALTPHVGAYKVTPEVPEHWLIAEDVAAVEPALVGLKDGEPYVVKTYGVVADLVAVIQMQQRRIEVLEQAISQQ